MVPLVCMYLCILCIHTYMHTHMDLPLVYSQIRMYVCSTQMVYLYSRRTLPPKASYWSPPLLFVITFKESCTHASVSESQYRYKHACICSVLISAAVVSDYTQEILYKGSALRATVLIHIYIHSYMHACMHMPLSDVPLLLSWSCLINGVGSHCMRRR
jgi:hypothetical protein